MARKPYVQERGRLRGGRVRQLRAPRSPAGWPQSGRERDRARGRQERRAVPREEARDDRPDARGAEAEAAGRLGPLLHAAEAPARPRACRCRAARCVGGSSSINGMVYVRGNRANYDSWAAEGNTGWSADEVNAAYKRMEDFEDGADDYRGAGGPIKVTRNARPRRRARCSSSRRRSDALGVPVLDDYNAESQEGVSRMQQNAARRPALLRLARLPPPPRRTHPAAADRGAGPQGRHRGRPRDRRRGHRQGRHAAHRPRRQGGHPLGRLRRVARRS